MTVVDGKKCCVNGCFQVKPVGDFARHPRSPDGYTSRCKTCELERTQRQRHGLTSADKTAVAAAQDGCAICGRRELSAKGWVVDHDRMCCAGDASCADCRRGVLCGWCNTALGYAGDDPVRLRRMADYLTTGTRLAVTDHSTDCLTDDALVIARTDEQERTNEEATDRHISSADRSARE